MDTHVKVAAWLRIIWSAFGLLGALVVLLLFGGLGALAGAAGDAEAVRVMPWISAFGAVVAAVMAVTSLPGLIAGWGLLTYQPWARILNIVLSILDLLYVPIGTAVGGYSLWVMFNPETVALFEGGGRSTRHPTHF